LRGVHLITHKIENSSDTYLKLVVVRSLRPARPRRYFPRFVVRQQQLVERKDWHEQADENCVVHAVRHVNMDVHSMYALVFAILHVGSGTIPVNRC
uniref:Uncharacterized protein n=1 Tax=Parascaris equorum TaxID=6256 RepID=A0A914R3L2_PAREQ